MIEIECSFAAEFDAEAEVGDDFMEIFIPSVVRVVCTPYAREFISSITSRMDLPAFFLPLFKVMPDE